ncbi:HEAT repeat domain-containing protein [Streptomyces zhihengii]
MRLIELFAEDREEKFCALAVDALTNWSASETNKGVLATVLLGLGSYAGPRAEAAILAHADHHDADVRRAVAASLGTSRDTPGLPAEAQEALLTLMGDPDPDLRIDACWRAGEEGQGDSALSDATAALLGHPERRVQLDAVYGLALHDDEAWKRQTV